MITPSPAPVPAAPSSLARSKASSAPQPRRQFLKLACLSSAGLCLPWCGCHRPESQSTTSHQPPPSTNHQAHDWQPLFNGKDLSGWTPKIRGFDLGENFGRTFRVEEGLLKVAYDQYQKFDNRFGHLFYREKFSHYRLRVEYRFVDEQTPGGPDWAFRNSGIMIHSQAPGTMARDQDFPVSLEVQLLGGAGTGERTTGNLCTPGTHVVMDGRLITQHCNNSRSQTYHGDQWVTIEVEVHGHNRIQHILEGQTVLAYSEPQLDPGDADAQKLAQAGASTLIQEGYLCLQAESHPVHFRKVELLRLPA